MFSFPWAIFKKTLILFFLLCFVHSPGNGFAENNGVSAKVLVNGLNFRSAPSKQAKPIGRLNQGERVIVLEKTSGWLKIAGQGKIGYITDDKKYVAVDPADAHLRLDPSTVPIGGLIKESQSVAGRLEKSRSAVKALSAEEKETFDGLDEIDNTLNQVRKKIREIKKNRDDLRQDIQTSISSASSLEKKIKEHRDFADKRMRALYKLHRLGGMAHVPSSNASLFDLARQQNSFKRLLKKDEDAIAEYSQNVQSLHAVLEEQKSRKTELEGLEASLVTKDREMTSERQKRSALLSKIQNRKEFELASQKMLSQASANLDKKIAAISKDMTRAAGMKETDKVADPVAVSKPMATESGTKGAFGHLKGLLNMPVKGKVIADFGDYKNPRTNVTLFRSGIDIQADRGEPVRAVFSGKVVYSEWFKGYGNMMIIDHGDHYYSVYANIDELFKATGDSVGKNEVIATVGDSGSLKGPKLYFEIRHHGKPLNPMAWIQLG